jgi:single-stranded DNA-binding protein
MENEIENNIVEIGGKLSSDIELSHELYDEKFYKFYIETNRLSSSSDKIPVIISERVIDLNTLNKGDIIHIHGQFRSYNEPTESGKSKLVLSIFTKEIEKVEDEDFLTLNDATFLGYICKPSIYRKTPLGREIADLLVAVNRTYKKSDYIPCILWGRNAKFCENIEIGTLVKLNGRIQSRKYEKKYEDGTTEEKVAYELSVSKFSVIKE